MMLLIDGTTLRLLASNNLGMSFDFTFIKRKNNFMRQKIIEG
jgi:hypothetical protein